MQTDIMSRGFKAGGKRKYPVHCKEQSQFVIPSIVTYTERYLKSEANRYNRSFCEWREERHEKGEENKLILTSKEYRRYLQLSLSSWLVPADCSPPLLACSRWSSGRLCESYRSGRRIETGWRSCWCKRGCGWLSAPLSSSRCRETHPGTCTPVSPATTRRYGRNEEIGDSSR